MAHHVWKCSKCSALPETGLEFEVKGGKRISRICKNCGGRVHWIKATDEDKVEQVKYLEAHCVSSYDELLKEKCETFKLHDFAMPHIPENWGAEGSVKVLQVGESNYIDGEKYDGDVIEDFYRNDWWDKELHISELAEKYHAMDWTGDYTRSVIYSFTKGYSDLFAVYATPAKLVLERKYGIKRPETGEEIEEYHKRFVSFMVKISPLLIFSRYLISNEGKPSLK